VESVDQPLRVKTGIYKFIGFDDFGITTAGPILIFENGIGEICFIITQPNLFLSISPDVIQKYNQFKTDANYTQLIHGSKYYLTLIEVRDISYIETRKVTTWHEEDLESSIGLMFSEDRIIHIIKDRSLTGKIYTCDQIYSDLIVKSSLVD